MSMTGDGVTTLTRLQTPLKNAKGGPEQSTFGAAADRTMDHAIPECAPR